MILRIFKTVVTAIILWYALSGLIAGIPNTIHLEWQTGLSPRVVFGMASPCLNAILCLVSLTSIWKFGSEGPGGSRIYVLQHKRLLLCVGGSYLFLLVLSGLKFEWRTLSEHSPAAVLAGAAVYVFVVLGSIRFWPRKDRKTMYGLHHGRLHLDAQVPMWMNMGYWKVGEKNTSRSKGLAEACRDLLKLVLAEAGFPRNPGNGLSACLIDVGFGCGEQTIHLMSDKPIRKCDELWWDTQDHPACFTQYVGITQDQSQCQYAQERVEELKRSSPDKVDKIALFGADAASPGQWEGELLSAINIAQSKSQETWLLALDTAYHFSPSRWVLIEHACQDLGASFMAFDLCLSPNATLLQKITLRVLTTVMGAPWANFATPEIYRQKLIDTGYPADTIKIVDISEHVFAPLAEYMTQQDRRLERIGLGLGSFQAAKWLFSWWGSTGVVRGVVAVARHRSIVP